jgi:hypothetical protein
MAQSTPAWCPANSCTGRPSQIEILHWEIALRGMLASDQNLTKCRQIGIMIDVERLTAILEALANPLTRQFIEMVAMRPRSTKELQQTFDLPLFEIETAGRILAKLGFLSERARTTRYDYDPRGLSEVADWITRVESIRSTSLNDGE